jgi:hypothetical protein
VTKCVRSRQCILIMRRHKRHPPHQNSLRSMLCFRRLRTIKRFEGERYIALYQKTIAIALWAKSEITTTEYSSFSKSTYRSSHLPETLKTLATSDKNITRPAMMTCCGASQKSSDIHLMSCSSEQFTPYATCFSFVKHSSYSVCCSQIASSDSNGSRQDHVPCYPLAI